MATIIYTGDGGSISHSVSQDNKVTVSITPPLTDGMGSILSFDGSEVIIFYIKDAAGLSEDSASPSMTFSNGTWSVADVDVSSLLITGITSVKYAVNITYGDTMSPSSMVGDLSADGALVITDPLTLPSVVAEKTVTTTTPILYSVQPINTYVRILQPNQLTFSDVGGVTFDGVDIGVTLSIDSAGLDPVQVPLIYGSPGYTGLVASSTLTGDMEELILGYSGSTYSTGITFTKMQPSLQFVAPPDITAGVTAGTLVVTFGNSNTVYQDNNYPVALGVGPYPGDGGNMVDKNGIIQEGPAIITDDTVAPGTLLVVGYQSTSALTIGTTFGTTEYYLDPTVGITLPGITYTSLSNQYLPGQGPQYGFNNLSVMGMTGSAFVNNLYLTTDTTAVTFGVAYGAPKSTVQITGVTYDVVGAFLTYSTGGETLAVSDFGLPLTGTVTVTAGDGTVTVTITGAQYGDLTEFTLHSSVSPFSGTDIVVTDGSGSHTYTGLKAGTVYSSSALAFNVVIPGGLSANNITSANGITVGGMAGSSNQLTLDYVFASNAGQTFTFNILGESGSTGITYSQTITLDVPVSTMNKVLGYSSNWNDPPGSSGTSGSQPQPVVALMLKEYLSYPLDDFSKGLTGTMAGITYPSNSLGVIEGDQGTTCTSLIREFQSISGFTYHASGGDVGVTTDYLTNIPQEAITSFTLSSVNTTPLSTIVGNLIDVGDGPLTTTPYADAVQSLFEQAVNAGMVQTAGETAGATLNNISTTTVGYGTVGEYFASAGSTAAVYGAQWAAGQELAIYVQYNLVKNRSYQLSPDVAVTGASGSTVLNFGGVTFELGGLSEESTAVPTRYKIVLHAV